MGLLAEGISSAGKAKRFLLRPLSLPHLADRMLLVTLCPAGCRIVIRPGVTLWQSVKQALLGELVITLFKHALGCCFTLVETGGAWSHLERGFFFFHSLACRDERNQA